MKRRSFLKSIGAFSLAPAMPVPSIGVSSAASVTVAKDTYQWAEMIVRAHNKCNLGMLQRLLQLDTATASALKSELLKNGVISAQANAYGMHAAIKPLYEGAFIRPTSEIKNAQRAMKSIQKKTIRKKEKHNEINPIDDEAESKPEIVESFSEEVEANHKEMDLALEDNENTDTLVMDETECEQEAHERTSR